MKIKNFFISIVTIILLLVPLNNCYAQEVPANKKHLYNSTSVDNHLYDSVRVENKQYNSSGKRYGQAATLDQMKSILKEAMENRENEVQIRYTGFECYKDQQTINFDRIKGIIKEILNENHYLKYSWKEYNVKASGYYGDLTITFKLDYLTTKVQEQYIDSKINSIVSQIITSNMNDYQKEKAIHDYIVSHVQYDTSLKEHSAYAALAKGKTVCQGYSLLMFKMLKKVGIKSIIVESESMNHAWNMVRIDNKWYHVDVTWDDPVPDRPNRISYDYYNLSDKEIKKPINGNKHTWNINEYKSAFYHYYPSYAYKQNNKYDTANIDLSIVNNVIFDIELNQNLKIKKAELFDGDKFLGETDYIKDSIVFIKYIGNLEDKLYKLKVTVEGGKTCSVNVKIPSTLDIVEVDNENKLVKIKALVDGELKVNDEYVKNIEKGEMYLLKSDPWVEIETVSIEPFEI